MRGAGGRGVSAVRLAAGAGFPSAVDSPSTPEPVFLRGDAVAPHPLEPGDAPFVAELSNEPAVRETLAADRSLGGRDEWARTENRDEHNSEGFDLPIRVDDDPVGTVGVADVVQCWVVGGWGS